MSNPLSELRHDPISGRTVIIAPERMAAVSLSQHSPAAPRGDATNCPFCPGREDLAGREILVSRQPGRPENGDGWHIRVVASRLPALRVEGHYDEPGRGLFQTLGGLGAHEVVIEAPEHDADWATMPVEQMTRVLWAWRERMRDLRRDFRLRTFLFVKNAGASAGATLDHPHSQLLALPFVPQHLEDELSGARARHLAGGRCVFCALIDEEIALDTRVVGVDADSIAISAFAARVPFETWILPRRHAAAFDEESDDSLRALAARLGDTMARLRHALREPPYSVLLHSVPVGEATDSYHWHLEILPRLLPVSGLAWDAGIHINPVPPEDATRLLRAATPR